MADMNNFLDQVREFDVNDIDWDRVGVWPLAARLFLFILAIIIVLVGTYFLVIKDKKQQLASSVVEETSLRSSFETKAFEASNLNAYRLQMIEMKESFDAVVAQLPGEIEVPDLLEDLDSKIVSSRLGVTSIDPLETESKEFYEELPIEIKVVGGYHEFGAFVSGIAGMSRIVTLHNFSIQAESASSTSGRLTMEITAKTYKYKSQDN